MTTGEASPSDPGSQSTIQREPIRLPEHRNSLTFRSTPLDTQIRRFYGAEPYPSPHSDHDCWLQKGPKKTGGCHRLMSQILTGS